MTREQWPTQQNIKRAAEILSVSENDLIRALNQVLRKDPPALNYMVRGVVPGGWIYSGWDYERDCVASPAVFVPEQP